MPTILTLDLGNTSLKGVLWEGAEVIGTFRWIHSSGDPSLGKVPRGKGLPCRPDAISRVLGVASRGLPREHGIPGLQAGEWVGADLRPPLAVDYCNPEEMGWDRRVAALALSHEEKEGGLILDAGTCLTLTHVDPRGTCRGFGIAPGLAALAGSFPAFAPDLDRDFAELPRKFPSAMRSTRQNLEAGIWAAFLGAAEKLLAFGRGRLAEMGIPPGILRVTGSDGSLLVEALGEGLLDQLLVHRGLLLLAGEGS